MGYFVDENIIGVGRALAAVRPDVVHPGHTDLPSVPEGTLDPDWIPIVGSADLVLITRDKKMRFRPGERALLAEYHLRVMALTSASKMTSWDMLGLLVRRWERMEKAIRDYGSGFWWCSITTQGVERRE